MTSQIHKKTCLVISYGPVPTPDYQTIEGGGMRAWGLAQGLRANGHVVTVAVNVAFPQTTPEYNGISLVNWSTDQQFITLLNSFDSVVVSYCMGSDSVFIAEHIQDHVQLILDCYVPIYVEVSARDADNMDAEYANYMADVQRFNRVLKRGDYFLCASQVQKIFYTGVLGSLGVVNPRSYRQGRILVVPFGLFDEPVVAGRNPYKELGVGDDDFTVLWFGGLYPWFRVEELMDAIKSLGTDKTIKFVIVGGKNPFNPNPVFAKQYDFALDYAKKHSLGKTLYFVDWVDFNERVNWFVHADLIISINNPGEENSFSWRTRVMDFVWSETPILTNGEDVLSEELLEHQAAARLPELSSAAISDGVRFFASHPAELRKLSKNVRDIKKKYHWNEIVSPLAGVISKADHPCIEEIQYRSGLPNISVDDQVSANRYARLVHQRLALVKKGLHYTRRYGILHTARLTHRKIRSRKKAGR